MKNEFIVKMRQGRRCVGTFSHISSEIAMEGLAYAGMDFVIIDGEHGTVGAETVQKLVRVANLHKMTPFVRTRDCSRGAVLSMLEAGAHGLVIPQINTVDEVRSLVANSRYYPQGSRGVFLGSNGGYGFADFAEKGLQSYFDVCNRETLIFPQCETKGCLENIEEIAMIPGVDGIFIGPYDLSVALGIPGQFDAPEFGAAVERIKAAVKAAGKMLITYTVKPEAVSKFFDEGYDAVALNVDVALMISLMRDTVKKARGHWA